MSQYLGQTAILIICVLCLSTSCDYNTPEKSRIEVKIDSIISKMTLEQKIGQTAQRGTSSREKTISEELKDKVGRGEIGSLLNVMNQEHVKELQRIAVEQSPNGIPLIFARDVIHGFKTIFPIPLGQAATWNPEIVEMGARIAAIEATNVGIRWTFAPMLDISRDPRWGRIAESSGEDPFLTSQMAKAYVRGFQTNKLSNPTAMAACAKHFVGYGAAEGGRDYNTVSISEPQLHNVYLKPFASAVEANVATFMTGFNELNGVPVSGNQFLLKDVLRENWSFDGLVVSDWNSVIEMVAHGYSKDEMHAAWKAANAGLDMEMTSEAYDKNLKLLIDKGLISENQIDEMVKNILRVKFRLNLFENPYFDTDSTINYQDEHLKSAKDAAIQSTVLLKNSGVLPLSIKNKKIAVIGPLANAPHEQLGTWTFDGEKEHTLTPLAALREKIEDESLSYSSGMEYSRDLSRSGFSEAMSMASKSDVIIFFGGEEAILSGEAHSRADIKLPGNQEELILELAELGKPIVLVIMAGRPITLGNILAKVDAVLMAWHPGTMGGPALSDILIGMEAPEGRLPVTWPKVVGQIPIYYNHKNTGRPPNEESYVSINDIPIGAWQSSLGNNSHYLDAGYTPQFPFGYGLTYTQFQYDNLQLSTQKINVTDTLAISVQIKNVGYRDGTEIVQLYIQDKFGSLTRPVKELKAFKKVVIAKGATEQVTFKLPINELAFYTSKSIWEVEPGDFNIWIGPNASNGLKNTFEVTAN